MKRFFVFFGSLLLVLVVLGAIGVAFLKSRSDALTQECHAYIEEAIPAVFGNWSPKELYDRASPELKKTATFDQVYAVLRKASVLGRLEKCDPPRGHAGVVVAFPQGKVTSGRFATRAEFERGEAEITLVLIKHGDQWQIHSFNIQSPDLSKSAANPAPSDPQPQQPSSAEEAQREAVRRYPDLGVAGSRLNLDFVARHKRYQKEHPEYFRDPSWPLRLAEESARAIKEK